MKVSEVLNLFILVLVSAAINLNAQWELKNKPNNHGCISSVCFLDSLNGLGTANQFLRTTDGGKTWIEKNIDGYSSSARLYKIDKNTLWLLNASLRPKRSTDGGETWNEVLMDTSINLGHISFVNDKLGMAIGWKKSDYTTEIIYKTTDGGITWQEKFSFATYVPILCISYTSEKTAYFSGVDILYKTTDGGNNWEQIKFDSLYYFAFLSSCFISDSIGIFSGYYGVDNSNNHKTFTAKTTDGGKSWKYTWQVFRQISLIDKKYGFACGENGIIGATTDCGDTWQCYYPNASVNFLDIAVIDTKRAIFFGSGDANSDETILKTWNGGKTFQRLDSARYYRFNTMRFINKQIGYGAGDYGEIFKTTNGGKNWQSQATGKYLGNITSGYFLDSLNGWYLMLNNSGKETIILRTTNGGSNWDSLFTIPYRLYSAHFHNKNTGFVSGPGGRIFKTTNGGKTWKSILTPYTYYDFVKITFTDEKHGWASADRWEIFKTNDGGDSWYSCRGGWGRYNDVVFVDSLYGWSTGICGFSDIPFVRTTDGGANWISFGMVLPTQMYGLNFPSIKTGYAIGGSGVICKTADSGATWRQLKFPVTSAISDISFVDELTGWVVTENGLIYYTNNGGEELSDTIPVNEIEQPKVYSLSQNYPNPFNPVTLIKYSIPYENRVVLTVYNLLGQKITELVNEIKPAGTYKVAFNAASLPSGVYFYKIESGDFSQIKKLLLVK